MKKYLWIFYFALAIWVSYFVDLFGPWNLKLLGVQPRTLSGLKGILFSPILHGSIWHLLSNFTTLIILSVALVWRIPSKSQTIIGAIYVLSGVLLWIIGGEGLHIGASGVVFGLFGFHVSFGWFRKKFWEILLSVLVLLIYGGLSFGLLPLLGSNISWEGHWSGLIIGVLVAYNYK